MIGSVRRHSRSSSVFLLAAAGLAMALAATVFLGQIEVSDDTSGATRTCGSAFDSAVDRSGWEQWWARDLDESSSVVESALTRTRHCPGAVNVRTAVAAVLVAFAGSLVVITVRIRGVDALEGGDSGAGGIEVGEPTVGSRLALLGRMTVLVGGALSLAGVTAVIVLVADSDSTLFLYTDRLIVAIVGLIALVPALVLLVVGRVVSVVAEVVDRTDEERTNA